MSNVSTSSSSSASVPVKRYDVRDFFKKPEKSSYRISPDGKHLAFLAPAHGRQNVHVQALGADGAPVGEARPLTSESARDVGGFFWKGGSHILYVKDFGGDENFHVVSVPIDGKTPPKDLTPFDGVRAQLVDDLENDDAHLLLSHNQRDSQVFDVFRIEVATGAGELVAENPGNITGWGTDHDGKLRVAVATDGVNNTLLYRDVESDEFKPILTTNFKEAVNPLFFTFDNRQLYVASNRGRDKAAVFEFDPHTAKEGKMLFEHPDVDVAGLSYSVLRKVLTEVSYVTWKPERHVLDPVMAAIYKDLTAQLPGYEVSLQSATRDETRFVVAAYSDRTQGSRYLYDSRSRLLTKLSDIQPGLAEADMAPMKPVHYLARDGMKIEGYLTLPVGREAKNLPVIIHPHGGPWARDVWGFSPEIQLLANRGYAVLQMNFRGSTGYGRKFWEASFRQWGKTMQDDITDGVEWLKQQGIADPKRIAIYGASYGGYATLAGITFTPDLYAAAVDYVGVANLFTFMDTIPPYWKPFLDSMHEMVGNPEQDKELLHAASPVFFVDRIKTPLFVAQGALDPRVNKAESDQIVSALKARGVDVEYMVKDNEGHGFHNEENQFEFYSAMEQFLAKHLG